VHPSWKTPRNIFKVFFLNIYYIIRPGPFYTLRMITMLNVDTSSVKS